MHPAKELIQIREPGREAMKFLFRLRLFMQLAENLLNDVLRRFETFIRLILVDFVKLLFRRLKNRIEFGRFVLRERGNFRGKRDELPPCAFFLDDPRVGFRA